MMRDYEWLVCVGRVSGEAICKAVGVNSIGQTFDLSEEPTIIEIRDYIAGFMDSLAQSNNYKGWSVSVMRQKGAHRSDIIALDKEKREVYLNQKKNSHLVSGLPESVVEKMEDWIRVSNA